MWEPITQDELQVLIRNGEANMESQVEAFWNRIKIKPQKWQLPPEGDEGGGFWVVAVVGAECIYYNDIEDGFNSSPFDHFGRIREYWCNQTELDIAIRSYRSDSLRDVGVNSD